MPLLLLTSVIRLTAAAAMLVFVGCDDAAERSNDPRPLVVVSVAPYQYLVESIAEGNVQITTLLPPGASPAGFEPGMDALRAIEQASLLVRVGHPHFPFERAWLDRLVRDRPDLRIVDATQAARSLGMEGEDPHIWLSPAATLALARALQPEIGRLLGNPPSVATQTERLTADIEALDAELTGMLAPVQGQRFLVFHPAWGHFARHFGLEQVAVERDGKHPGPQQLAALITEAKQVGYRSIFVVPQTDPSQARSVAEALGASVVELDPLDPDWPDAMRRTARLLAREAAAP